MKDKALIYCRVSSTRQKTQGSGLESQEFRCRQFAQQNGYDVEAVFQDDFSGGGDFWQRPAMRQLLSFLEVNKGESYTIIFDDLKRFARDIEFHWKLRNELKQRNAKPLCLNFNFEETPEGEFIETVIASMGQLERKQNQRQVCQKMKARLEKGYWTFQPPLGMQYVKDKAHGKVLALKEPDATWVKQALEGYAYGVFPHRKEVQRFLEEKLNRKIYNDLPRHILLNPLYAGFIEYKAWDVSWRKAHHDGLISLEVFEKNVANINGNALHYNRVDEREEFPLRGYVDCAECGRSITAAWTTGYKGKKYPYYRCVTQKCIGSMPKDSFESQFTDFLKLATPKPSLFDLLERCVKNELEEQEQTQVNRLQSIERQINDTEHERAKLIKLAVQTSSSTMRAAYESEVLSADEKIKNLRNELFKNQQLQKVGTVQLRGKAILEDPYLTWKTGNLKTRQDVQSLVFGNSLRFSKKSSFGTAEKPCVYRIFSDLNKDESVLVDVVRCNWNVLMNLIYRLE